MATGGGDQTPDLSETGTKPKSRNPSGTRTPGPYTLPSAPTDISKKFSPTFDETEFLANFAHLNILESDTAQEKKLKRDLAQSLVQSEKQKRHAKFLENQVMLQTAENARLIAKSVQVPQPAPQAHVFNVPPPQGPQFINPGQPQPGAPAPPPPHQPPCCPGGPPCQSYVQPPQAQHDPPQAPNTRHLPLQKPIIPLAMEKPPQLYELEDGTITVDTPQQDQILVKKKMAEGENSVATLFANMQNMFGKMMQLPSNANQVTDDLIADFNRTTMGIQNFSTNAQIAQAQLATADVMRESYKTQLPIPEFAADESHYPLSLIKKLETRNLNATFRSFNPDTNPEADFTDLWTYIISFSGNVLLSEETYKQILLNLLHGSAHSMMVSMTRSGDNLKKILETLSSLYCKHRTRREKESAVNKFQRIAGESLEATMTRARYYVEKVRPNYTVAKWPGEKKSILDRILDQVINASTKAYLTAEAQKYEIAGVPLKFDAKISLAEIFETSHDEIPRRNIGLIFDVCTGKPLHPYSFNPPSNSMLHIAAATAGGRSAPRSKSRDRGINPKAIPHAEELLPRDPVHTPLPTDDWDMERRTQMASSNQATGGSNNPRPRGRSPGKSLGPNSYDPLKRTSSKHRSIDKRSKSRDKRSQSKTRQSYTPGQGYSQVGSTPPQTPTQYQSQSSQPSQGQGYTSDSSYVPQEKKPRSASRTRNFPQLSRSKSREALHAFYRQKSLERKQFHNYGPTSNIYPHPYYPQNLYPNPPQTQGFQQNQGFQQSQGFPQNQSYQGNNYQTQNSNPYYNNNGGQRGRKGRNRGNRPATPHRPHFQYEKGGKKISFSNGNIQFYYCENGCDNILHPTTTVCPKKTPLN